MKNIETLHECIADAKRSGADYTEIFVQSGAGHSSHYEDGRIDELSSSKSDGSGSRLIVGGKTYYSHAPGITPERISMAFAETSGSALGKKVFADARGEEVIEPPRGVLPPDADILRRLDKLVRGESKLVCQASFRYSASSRNVLIIRSDGTAVDDTRTYTSFAAQVVAEKDGVLQTGFERRCMAVPAEVFWNGCAPEDIAMNALRRALLMLEARPCPAGTMNVLLAGEAGGTIIHEACGHGLEADIVDKDHSTYRGRLGQKVASEAVTMVDDPTLPGLYGSYRYDDEGTPAQRTVLIENGILKNYLSDVNSALLSKLPVTGNGRRESYRYIPVPRMSNTFLEPGTDEFEAMLERAGNGLFVKKMGGGEVNPTSGDFVFYVSEGYLIKDGKIGPAVRGAILTGNGPKALENITALGHNLVMDPGVCGKSGQGVPVTDGQPSMLVEGLTVGGSEA